MRVDDLEVGVEDLLRLGQGEPVRPGWDHPAVRLAVSRLFREVEGQCGYPVAQAGGRRTRPSLYTHSAATRLRGAPRRVGRECRHDGKRGYFSGEMTVGIRMTLSVSASSGALCRSKAAHSGRRRRRLGPRATVEVVVNPQVNRHVERASLRRPQPHDRRVLSRTGRAGTQQLGPGLRRRIVSRQRRS